MANIAMPPLSTDPNRRAVEEDAYQKMVGQNPGAAVGGTGTTGVSDLSGWDHLLELQSRYANNLRADQGQAPLQTQAFYSPVSAGASPSAGPGAGGGVSGAAGRAAGALAGAGSSAADGSVPGSSYDPELNNAARQNAIQRLNTQTDDLKYPTLAASEGLQRQKNEILGEADASNEADARYGDDKSLRGRARAYANELSSGKAAAANTVQAAQGRADAYALPGTQSMMDDQAARAAQALAPKLETEQLRATAPIDVQTARNAGSTAVATIRGQATQGAATTQALGNALAHGRPEEPNTAAGVAQLEQHLQGAGGTPGVGAFAPQDEAVIAAYQKKYPQASRADAIAAGQKMGYKFTPASGGR